MSELTYCRINLMSEEIRVEIKNAYKVKINPFFCVDRIILSSELKYCRIILMSEEIKVEIKLPDRLFV